MYSKIKPDLYKSAWKMKYKIFQVIPVHKASCQISRPEHDGWGKFIYINLNQQIHLIRCFYLEPIVHILEGIYSIQE